MTSSSTKYSKEGGGDRGLRMRGKVPSLEFGGKTITVGEDSSLPTFAEASAALSIFSHHGVVGII
jgi:hypothetical protein